MYKNITALHVSIDSSNLSVSTQISAPWNLLQGEGESELAARFEVRSSSNQSAQGKFLLAIEVHSAGIMDSLISFKKEIETP